MVTMRLGRLPLVDSDRDLIYISGQPAYIEINPHEDDLSWPHMISVRSPVRSPNLDSDLDSNLHSDLDSDLDLDLDSDLESNNILKRYFIEIWHRYFIASRFYCLELNLAQVKIYNFSKYYKVNGSVTLHFW